MILLESHAVADQSSTGNIDIHTANVVGHSRHGGRTQLEVWVAWWRMLTVVFQSVQVLVTLATDLAAVWLLFLHTDGTWIWNRGGRVNDRKGTVRVLLKLLVLVTVLRRCQPLGRSIVGHDFCWRDRSRAVRRQKHKQNSGAAYLFVVLETILVLVCLLASDDRTLEGLNLLVGEPETTWVDALRHLLVSHSPCEVVILTELIDAHPSLDTSKSLFTEKSLGGIVDGSKVLPIAVTDIKPRKIEAITRATRRNVVGIQVELTRITHSAVASSLAERWGVNRGDGRVVGETEVFTGSRRSWRGKVLALKGRCGLCVDGLTS